jgi:y4mF family transcriptional regulator
MSGLSEFVKERRKEENLTQEEFAERAGVALTVIRKIEQGKTNLNLDKVNLVLKMFGHELVPTRINDSFLYESAKENYKELMNQRFNRLQKELKDSIFPLVKTYINSSIIRTFY